MVGFIEPAGLAKNRGRAVPSYTPFALGLILGRGQDNFQALRLRDDKGFRLCGDGCGFRCVARC